MVLPCSGSIFWMVPPIRKLRLFVSNPSLTMQLGAKMVHVGNPVRMCNIGRKSDVKWLEKQPHRTHQSAPCLFHRGDRYQVLDPRLMYTMTALRFSQDGNEALFSVQDIAFNPERGCSMAYGRYKCKDRGRLRMWERYMAVRLRMVDWEEWVRIVLDGSWFMMVVNTGSE